MPDLSSTLEKIVMDARTASMQLAKVSPETKNRALRKASTMITEKKEELLAANRIDIEKATAKLKSGELAKSLFDRLKLDNSKIIEISNMVASVADLEDPVGKTVYSIKMDVGLDLFKVTVPFGVIVSIFEARPDALPQIASLCLKSGNSVILKGGSEAKESNRAMFNILREALMSADLPVGSLHLIEEREAVNLLLKMEGLVDLIIPRGSNEFVRFIQENTRIPVLGHSAGICHIFVDSNAEFDMAISICHDARVQYPAACNAMKILLIHEGIAKQFLPSIAKKMIESNVEIKGCPKTMAILKAVGIGATPAEDKDWSTEYLDLTLPVKVVKDVDEAISHINKYGSKHTDSIITEDASIAQTFVRMVDSSTVAWNASTRFSDGYRYGLGAEVGISTNKVHARGPVGLEGLVTTKYVLLGSGQKVGDYVGKNAKPFLHEKMDTNLNRKFEM